MESIVGNIINERFHVLKAINKGSYGTIFACQDLLTNKETVIKLSEEYPTLASEI